MTVSMMIGLWVFDELSFNKSFKNYNSIGQVMIRHNDIDGLDVNKSMAIALGTDLRINFKDDLTHVETVDLDEVGNFALEHNILTLEKGYCKSPFLEDLLLSFGLLNKDAETCQYGLWSKLFFSSYIILYKQ